MRNNNFFKSLLLLVSILFFASCDKDYNEIGDALIGENHFDFDKNDLSTVKSESKKTTPIASNNLAVNALGVLDNSIFGKTTANFVTQAELATVNPTIDPALGQTIESVILYVPYFNKLTSTESDGSHKYTLDSIYGNKNAKLKLSVYENTKLLNSFNEEPGAPLLDPNYPQVYYTDQNADFDIKKGMKLNNNTADVTQNTEFWFNPNEHKIETAATSTTAATTTYIAPGMRLELDKTFFNDLLFKDASIVTKTNPNLSSNDVFKNYFKGLYFNVEKSGTEGVLAMLNFKKGTIVVNYKEKTLASDTTPLVQKSITLNLTGNTVNLLTNDFSSSGIEYSSNPKSDRLYLRGGEGSIGKITLFNPDVDVVTYNRTSKKIEAGANKIPDELDYIKEKGWLINQAILTFYIDQTAMSGVDEPNRIFLYDAENRVPILDYYYDGTTSSYPNYAKQVLGGIIEKDAGGRGVKYKIRITNYLRDLLNNDKSNVKLGVSVSQAISNINFSKVRNNYLYAEWIKLSDEVKNSYYFPEASVMNPLGTVLYGSNYGSTPDEAAKRIKLEIYYTKPN